MIDVETQSLLLSHIGQALEKLSVLTSNVAVYQRTKHYQHLRAACIAQQELATYLRRATNVAKVLQEQLEALPNQV